MPNRYSPSLVKLPSERRFGSLFAGIFFFSGCYVVYKSLPLTMAEASFAVATIFGVLAAFKPDLLRPLNLAWAELGLLLGKVVSPLVMGIVFFFVITPVAIAMRIAGRDVLKLRKQKVQSHWIDRSPVGPPPSSFKDQF